MTTYHLQSLAVVLKLAEICNLSCSYCYYNQKDDWKTRPAFLDEALALKVVEWLSVFLEEHLVDELRIVFHGGEPTLLDAEVAEFLCRLLRQRLSHLTNLHFFIQTNAYFITPAWRRLLLNQHVSIGVSLDGPPDVNDSVRVTLGGRPTSARVRATVEKIHAEARKHDDASVGVICVVDSNSNIPASVKYVFEELRADGLNALLNYLDASAENLDPARFAAPLIELFNQSLLYPGLVVRELSHLYGALSRPESSFLRIESEHIRYPTAAVTIYTDGSLSLDDSMASNADWYQAAPVAGIDDFSLAEFLALPAVRKFQEALHTIPAPCRSCKFATACRGGRLQFRYTREAGFDNRSRYCASYYEFFDHVVDELSGAGMPLERLQQALSLSNAT